MTEQGRTSASRPFHDAFDAKSGRSPPPGRFAFQSSTSLALYSRSTADFGGLAQPIRYPQTAASKTSCDSSALRGREGQTSSAPQAELYVTTGLSGLIPR
jgi:hypothetical protein